MSEGDPLEKFKDQLIAESVITADDYAKLDQEIKERIRQEFIDAEKEEDPTADELHLQVTGELPQLDEEVLPPGKYRIGDVVNLTLRAGLNEEFEPDYFRRRRGGSEGRRLSPYAETLDRFSRAGFQFTAGRVDHHGRGLRARFLRQTAGLRVAVCRFHQPRLESARDQSFHFALALFRHVDLPARHLRPLRRLPSRRQPLAQPGERGSPRPLSRDSHRHPEQSRGRRRPALERDACGRPDLHSAPETFALGGTRVGRAASPGVVRQSAPPSRRGGRDRGRVGQHDGEIDRGAGQAGRQNQCRVDRSALDRALGPGSDRGLGPQNRPARRRPGRHGELQRRPDDHLAHHRPGRALGGDGQPADSGQQRQRHDRLQSDLRIRRAARCRSDR